MIKRLWFMVITVIACTNAGYALSFDLDTIASKMEKPEQTGTVRRSRLGHF